MCRKSATTFDDWLATVDRVERPVLKSFAVELEHDLAAVEAAMTKQWSNRPTEGHVNRLESINRQMCGSASLSLLRAGA